MKTYSLENKSCLVTGGKGLIGSHLVKELLGLNNSVIVFDKEPLETISHFTIEGLSAKVKFVQGDVTVSEQVDDLLQSYDIDYVFHLAAQPITPLSNIEPSITIATNVNGTHNICNAIIKSGKRPRLLFASSACYYGIATKSPLSENDLPNLGIGHSIYTRSKIQAEKIVHDYHVKEQVSSIICRFVNVYGPGDRHGSRIIPKTIKTILSDESPVLSRSSGDSVFSFMYVKDAVFAFLKAASHCQSYSGEIFNFGLLGDNPRSVKELIRTIYKVAGKKIIEPVIPSSTIEPRVVKYLDPSKAIEHLDWSPTTDIETGLMRTIEWEQIHGNSLDYFKY